MTENARHATSNFRVVAAYRLDEETADEALGHLAQLAEASRKEPANLGYEYFRNVENSLHITILEMYIDEAGFEAHRTSSHFTSIGTAKILPLLADRVVIGYTDGGALPSC
ncbi:antibiotic biosynthesis monooxygenase [Rhodococcus sp. KBW08]|uniref:putative quinol monooxygenase n=1 Tax=Rhodococcus sp. KBW08 TaxID=2144188 RepID=UPI000F5AAD39|nr:putative quinol monooxygenase [Rhodococcus sp. KBW08]RQO46056.1 antibiotic biosynthesis monooxygenase [Rhodococcus sp. KBW08]